MILRKYKLVFLLVALLSGTAFSNSILENTPCPSDENISINDLPQAAKDYINANYNGATISDIEKIVDGTTTYYKIELKSETANMDDMEVVFDETGGYLGAAQESELATADLPTAAMTTLNTNYPGKAIDEIELKIGWNGQMVYEVTLEAEQEIELLLDMTGNMVCEDN